MNEKCSPVSKESTLLCPIGVLEVASVIPIYHAIDVILSLLYSKPAKEIHRNNALTDRNSEIRRLHSEGHSIIALAKKYGISSQRIHQIVNFRRK